MTATEASNLTRSVWAARVPPSELDAMRDGMEHEIRHAAVAGRLAVENPHRGVGHGMAPAVVEAAYQRLRDVGFVVTRPHGEWLVEW